MCLWNKEFQIIVHKYPLWPWSFIVSYSWQALIATTYRLWPKIRPYLTLNQPDFHKTLPKSLRVNQYTSSMTDTKLTPRQSPQMPPRLEMKSSQVILGAFSNSEWEKLKCFLIHCFCISKPVQVVWTENTFKKRFNPNYLFVQQETFEGSELYQIDLKWLRRSLRFI